MRNVKDVKKYRVVGFSYTRPKKTLDSRGEAILYQEYVNVFIKGLIDFGFGQMKVEGIEYDHRNRLFKVFLPKGCIKVIPYRSDMDICYEEVKSNG